MGLPAADSGYSRSQVRRILKIRENRLRSWERHGLCEERGEFRFSDLVALRTLLKLRQDRIPPRRIKDSLSALRKSLPGVEQPLTELKIVANGRRLEVDLPGARMEAITGQLLLDFETSSAAPTPKTVAHAARRNGVEKLQQAEQWFRRGLEIEELGVDDEGAMNAYERALELNPDAAGAWVNWIETSSAAPTPKTVAMNAYERALELNPDAAGAWVNIGTLRYRRGDLAEAERCYREALRTSPHYPLAHFNLGNISEETSRLDEAIECYELALRLQPNYADAHYNLALVYERQREPMRAAKHWREYLQLDSSSPWSRIARQQLDTLLQVMPGGRQDS